MLLPGLQMADKFNEKTAIYTRLILIGTKIA
jgi:hypothetical protein